MAANNEVPTAMAGLNPRMNWLTGSIIMPPLTPSRAPTTPASPPLIKAIIYINIKKPSPRMIYALPITRVRNL
jgi:hypothetical protein